MRSVIVSGLLLFSLFTKPMEECGIDFPAEMVGIIFQKASLSVIGALCATSKYQSLCERIPFLMKSCDRPLANTYEQGSVERFLIWNQEACTLLSHEDYARVAHHCAQKNDKQMMQFLMECESDYNKTHRYTVMEFFTPSRHTWDDFQAVIKAYKGIAKNKVLFDATKKNNYSVCEAAIACGADVNMRSIKDPYDIIWCKSLLCWAIDTHNNDLVRLFLLSKKIDVNPRHGDVLASLIEAFWNCDEETFGLLTSHPGIDINASDHSGDYVLKYAAMFNHIEKVKKLLAHKSIDIEKRDAQGLTAYHYAFARGNNEIVALLREHQEKNKDK